jgi:SAM-dependent methyltransferase
MDVVDLCCGDGWFPFPLSKIARSVVAIDIDRKLLDAAKVRFDERGGAPNVTLIEADAYDLGKYVHAPVDHVFLANTFHGVPDRPRLTRAVRDVLKPDGLFAVVNWYARAREETTVMGQPRGPADIETALRKVECNSSRLTNGADLPPRYDFRHRTPRWTSGRNADCANALPLDNQGKSRDWRPVSAL